MSPFRALIAKDLKLFFGDRRSVIMSFIAPILIGSFFGYVFGGSPNSEDAGKTAVLIVDQENSTVSQDVVSRLKAEKTLDAKLATAEEARDLVRKGKVPVALIIPPDFGTLAARALFRPDNKPTVTLLIDPSHKVEAAMVQGMLTGHVMQAVSKEAFGGPTGREAAADGLKALDGNNAGLPPDQASALRTMLKGASNYNGPSPLGGNGGGFSMPFTTSEEQITSETGVPYNGYAHSFGGMAIQFTLFMGVDIGIGLLLQRQRGLWKRFRAAPLSKLELLGSRAVSGMLISVIILTVVFAFARAVFNVHMASIAGFLAISAAFGLMTSAYGLLIASLGKTPETARGLSILATILMVMLSGAWVPSFLFPAWLQSATQAVPARWAMDGLDGMTWRGLAPTEAVMPTLVLLGFSVLFGVVAVSRFRWEE